LFPAARAGGPPVWAARVASPWLGLLCGVLLGPVAAATDAPPDFNRDIRPILSHNCFACHGPDEHDRQGGLRLDVRAAAVAELDSGATAIVPGRPDESELIARIHDTDPDTIMPPPESNHVLTAGQKELLARWIAAGAAYAPHWAYVAPQAHAPPPVRDGRWPTNWIDRFVLGRLEAEGLAPAPDADPVTLVRRLSFDLTGLPPTPAEVEAYLADTSGDRYEKLVERLLASPRHAERMAAWWLDLVRYADTVGYHGDQDHSSSPYRDWAIKAFLDDVPFDRFTVLQLAGDLVGPSDGEHPDDPVLASGYNRLLQTTHEGGLQLKEYRAIYQADRIRNVSGAWMGATVGCAQCHDHKYDPYTARDFYRLGAFFADIDDEKHMDEGGFGGQNVNAIPTIRDPEVRIVGPFDRAAAAELDARIHSLRNQLPRLVLPPRAQPPEPEAESIVAGRIELAGLQKHRGQLDRKLMITKSLDPPREVRILPRGNWMDETGPLVGPAIPAFLGGIDTKGRPTRADLARWLVTPVAAGGVGEYTARVTANRIWSLFFGAGLCRSVGDFGGQGELPDHPELLDRLAVEFLQQGWSVRKLVRAIVTSHAYRQSSDAPAELLARDPDNRLLARQGRWRYPAEGVRDAALFASGLLVEQLGGASVHPYQPAGYYRHLNFPQREYQADADSRQWRRGLYVHWQRMFLHPQLLAFDASTREECTAARMRSNTPKAALVLLNDPTFVEAARKLAELAVVSGGAGDDDRIAFLWNRTLSRTPDAEELTLVKGLLDRRRAEYRADPTAAGKLLAVGIATRDTSLDPIELAAWTTAARAVLNLHEAISRY
jgi:mono/diheme cytochrome c family protein